MTVETGGIDIRLDGRLGGFHLDIAFSAPAHGITALFGPSGCGKTSVLRSAAGLQRVPGVVRIGSEVWQDDAVFVAPHRRAVGYVFQEPSLFPHLSVRENLAYGRKRALKAGGAEIIRFDDVVDLLGLGRLIDRDPAHLSGGERQRVSIGRALLSQPRLMLMDEPLSALDRMAKDEILPYFEALHAGLSLPILLVSHDISEVERLADHMVYIRAGKVVSSAPLNAVLTDPGLPFAQSREFAAVLPARAAGIDGDGVLAIDVFGTTILALARGEKGQALRVRIAAGDVSLTRLRPEETSVLNVVEAQVEAIDPVGEAEVNVHLILPGAPEGRFASRISRRSAERLAIRPGERLFAQIKGVSLVTAR